MNAKWVLMVCGLLLPCWAQAGQNPVAPASAPARLTVVDSATPRPDVYAFGNALFGESVTHGFTLRNDGATPVALARVALSCGCLSTPLATQPGKPLPVLMPGATLRVDVTLDTTRLPSAVNTPLLAGGEIEKQVRLYAAGQPVHAAAVLTLRGRIVSGVRIQPPCSTSALSARPRGAVRLSALAWMPRCFGRDAPALPRLKTVPCA